METRDTNVIRDIKGWVSDVIPRQLPRERLGNVVPYCSVWIYELHGSHRTLTASNALYAIDGGRTERKLLSEEEIDRVNKLFELVKER